MTISWVVSYTVIAVIVLVGVFFTFISLNRTFIWKQDGMYVYLPSFAYGGHYIREGVSNIFQGNFSFPMYDFSYGMGMSVYNLILGMFTDPFQLVAVIFPMSKVELAYNISVLLRFYSAGLTFLCFCRYKKWDRVSALIGSVIYMASGFALYAGIKHPSFMTPMVLLPLLLIGAEKVLHRKGKFFVTIVAIAMASSYYFMFMMTIVMAIYMVVRFFEIYKEKRGSNLRKVFVKTAGCYIAGLMLAAFSYLPQILSFFNSVRTGEVIKTDSLLHYNATYYKKFIGTLITPYKNPGYWVFTGFAAIALLVIAYLLMQRKKEERGTKILFLLYTLLLCIPFFAFILSGFNSISNRWCFVYAFLVAAITAKYIRGLEQLKKVEAIGLTGVTIVYATFVMACSDVNNKYTRIGVVTLGIFLVTILFFNYIYHSKKVFLYGILLLVIGNVVMNAYYMYSIGGYAKDYVKSGEGLQTLMQSPYKEIVKLEDNSFYRVEQIDHTYASGNRGLLYDLNTTAQYSSINRYEFNKYQQQLLNAGIKDIVMIYDLDGRTILDTLAGVKYYAVRAGEEQYVPYGYRLASQSKKYGVYENLYALPIGYTYNKYILQSEYEKLSPLDRQYTMMQAAVVEEDSKSVKEMELEALQGSSEEIHILDMQCKNVVITDNTIKVSKKNGTIRLTFTGVPHAETYVLINNLKPVSKKNNSKIIVTYDSVSKSSQVQGAANIYVSPRKDYLTNLGQTKDGTQMVTIQFSKKGEFTFDSIQLLSQSMKNYEAYATALGEVALENVKLGTDTVTGTITASDNRLLCFAIPYDEGWNLTVDGEKAELIPMNGMYMGTTISEGSHDVCLTYHVVGAKAGWAISITSLALFLIYCLVVKKSCKR